VFGDFSRGHEPDRARGRHYRRVLLQQGRPLLDSDVAAEVDAVLEAVRATTRTLGCRVGSSDIGFLVTPGRLVTIFSRVRRRLTVTAGTPDVWVDFRFRYADRYPALHLGAPAGLVRVQVPATQPLAVGGAGRAFTLWAHVESATSITVNGTTVPLAPRGPGPAPYSFSLAGTTLGPIELSLSAGEVWLYLLETLQPAGQLGTFGVAPGTYQLDGMVATTRGGAFPDQPFPDNAGFGWDDSPPTLPLGGLTEQPVAGDRVVAYLEVWERVITAVEDPGIREVALGSIDTTVRTQLMAQVKLAPLATAVPQAGEAGLAHSAFDAVEESGGELFLTVPAGSTTPDPCALPSAEGYSGDDNRLYRIQVHSGGSLSQVLFSWSRDNASELFAATLSVSGELVLDAATALAAGDLVEVLSSVVDLGDDQQGSVSAAGFVPAQRAVGQLGQLVEVPSQAGDDTVRFRLVDVDDATVPVAPDDRYGDLTTAGLKLRRWHGVLDPQRLAGGGAVDPSASYVLEDGITVSLSSSGTYRPGQYWQYQARAGVTPAEQWQSAPHGPERWFAPLALLRLPDSSPPGTDVPWDLVAWLDERFDHLCDLQADDITFDGDRIPTGSDTVQEALEELYSRIPAPQSWPRIAADGISWRNDRTLSLAAFTAGLRVTFSEEMNAATATTSSFVVTLEVPDDSNPAITIPHIIDGAVNVSGRTWTFVPRVLDGGQVAAWEQALGHGVRGRVRLAGDVILDQAGVRPLDGESVGVLRTEGYDTWVDLRLPSGDGQRGGDFESWFFLAGPPPLVRVESVSPGPDVQLAANQPPGAIMISFTHPVRFDTLTPDTLQVLARTETQRGQGQPVAGKIQPYPFEAHPRLVSRVTFVPDDPADLQQATLASGETQARVVTIKVTGGGDHPVRDAGGRAIDAAGSGDASDFSSTFTVGTPRQP
jgi:hypothetical protein